MSNANANAQQFEEQTFIKTNALVMPSADMLNSLNDADVGMAMRAKYWTPQTPGEKIRAYFTGMGVMVSTDQTGKQREVPAANFVGPNGAFIHAGTTLVDQVQNLPPGTPVEIVYEGVQKNKTNAGSTKVYVVRLLNAPAAGNAAVPQRQALPQQRTAALPNNGPESRDAVELTFPLSRIQKAKPHLLNWSQSEDIDGNKAAMIGSTYEGIFSDMTKLGIHEKAKLVAAGDSSQIVAKKAYDNILILEAALSKPASEEVLEF